MRARIPAYDYAIQNDVPEINRAEFRTFKALGWEVVAFEDYLHIGSTTFYRPVYRYRRPEVA